MGESGYISMFSVEGEGWCFKFMILYMIPYLAGVGVYIFGIFILKMGKLSEELKKEEKKSSEME